MLENTQNAAAIVAENRNKKRLPFGFGYANEAKAYTFDEACKLPELDFEAEKVPYTINGEESKIAFCIRRKDNGAELGHVGNAYTPPQPHEIKKDGKTMLMQGVNHKSSLRMVESLLGVEGCHISNVKIQDAGSIIRVLVRVPKADFNVLGDVTEGYVVLTHYYNGQGKSETALFMHQLICTNGMKAWLQEAKISHRKSAHAALHEAKATTLFEQTLHGFSSLKEKMELLASRKMTSNLFKDYMKTLSPNYKNQLDKLEKEGKEFQNAQVEFLTNAFDAPNVPEFNGTAKAAFDAVTDYVSNAKTAPKKGMQGGKHVYDTDSQMSDNGTGMKLIVTASEWLDKNLANMPYKMQPQTFAMPDNFETGMVASFDDAVYSMPALVQM